MTITTAAQIKVAELFETRECGRCGGCGRYSWNALTGSVCFGCNGRGWQFTKRGLAAYNHFTALMSKPTSGLAVGDKIRNDRGKWETVESVTVNDGGTYYVQTNRCGYQNWSPDKSWRVAQSEAEKIEKANAAVAYQSTLTKAGTPRKVQA